MRRDTEGRVVENDSPFPAFFSATRDGRLKMEEVVFNRSHNLPRMCKRIVNFQGEVELVKAVFFSLSERKAQKATDCYSRQCNCKMRYILKDRVPHLFSSRPKNIATLHYRPSTSNTPGECKLLLYKYRISSPMMQRWMSSFTHNHDEGLELIAAIHLDRQMEESEETYRLGVNRTNKRPYRHSRRLE